MLLQKPHVFIFTLFNALVHFYLDLAHNDVGGKLLSGDLGLIYGLDDMSPQLLELLDVFFQLVTLQGVRVIAGVLLTGDIIIRCPFLIHVCK